MRITHSDRVPIAGQQQGGRGDRRKIFGGEPWLAFQRSEQGRESERVVLAECECCAGVHGRASIGSPRIQEPVDALCAQRRNGVRGEDRIGSTGERSEASAQAHESRHTLWATACKMEPDARPQGVPDDMRPRGIDGIQHGHEVVGLGGERIVPRPVRLSTSPMPPKVHPYDSEPLQRSGIPQARHTTSDSPVP